MSFDDFSVEQNIRPPGIRPSESPRHTDSQNKGGC